RATRRRFRLCCSWVHLRHAFSVTRLTHSRRPILGVSTHKVKGGLHLLPKRYVEKRIFWLFEASGLPRHGVPDSTRRRPLRKQEVHRNSPLRHLVRTPELAPAR